MELLGLNGNRIFFFIAFLLMNIAVSLETAKIHIRNNCDFKVWPAIIAEAGNGEPSSSGFELGPAGDSRDVLVPAHWSGSVWARTGCAKEDRPSINGTLFWCITGDCGSTTVNCSAAAGGKVTREVTVVRLKLKNGITDYKVTLVDIPMSVGVLKINEDDMSTPSTTFDISLCSSPPPPISEVTEKNSDKSWGIRTLQKKFLGRRLLPYTVVGGAIFVLVVVVLMATLCRRSPNNITTIGNAQNVQMNINTYNHTSLTL